MPTFDFQSGIDADFINDADEAWDTATLNGSLRGRSASPGDNGYSTLILLADFEAGDVDFDYRGDGESGFDRLYFSVDDEAAHLAASGDTNFTAVTSKTIIAGVHALIFTYTKDAATATGTDRGYIDNLVVPAYTLFDMSDAEKFGSGIPAGWTNDPTGDQEWSADTRGLYGDSVQSATGQSSSDSDLEHNSGSGASSGTLVAIYSYSSEPGFDFARVLVDASQVVNISGHLASNTASPRFGLHAYIDETISSGAHEYIFRYTKDSSGDEGGDRMHLHAVYEPGMTVAGGPTIPLGQPPLHSFALQRAANY